MGKTWDQKAARKIQDATDRSYQACLMTLRRAAAAQVKPDNIHPREWFDLIAQGIIQAWGNK